MHARVVLGVGKCVLFREVSQFRSVLMREVPLYRLAVVVCQKPPLSLSNQGCVRATPAIGC